MKKIAFLLASAFALSACAEETYFVDITVDPVFGKGGAVVAYEPILIAPVQ